VFVAIVPSGFFSDTDKVAEFGGVVNRADFDPRSQPRRTGLRRFAACTLIWIKRSARKYSILRCAARRETPWQVDAKWSVAPAQAGAQKYAHKEIKHFWIPAYAGMTEKTLLREFCIKLLGIAVAKSNRGAAQHDPPDLLEFGWTKGH
jgi:hypothetical protein